jgi:hypothetical protein
MSGTLLGFFLIAATLAQILIWRKQNDVGFGTAINEWRVPFATFIYGILGVPYLLSLGVYHLFLMARGETTREYLNSHKFLKKDRHRPFTQGSSLKNWLVVRGGRSKIRRAERKANSSTDGGAARGRRGDAGCSCYARLPRPNEQDTTRSCSQPVAVAVMWKMI